MNETRFPNFLIIVGAFALLLIIVQTVEPRARGVNSSVVSRNVARADVLEAPTPGAPVADPGNRPGMPGAPITDTVIGPEGQIVPGPGAVSDSDIAYTPASGIPAITPHINTSPGPAFTLSDVAQYHNSNYPNNTSDTYGAAGYKSTVAAALVSNEFLTVSQLRARESSIELNLPDDTLLCFAQYSGAFVIPVGPFGDSTSGSTRSAPFAFQVFHSQTGNVLMWGTNTSLK